MIVLLKKSEQAKKEVGGKIKDESQKTSFKVGEVPKNKTHTKIITDIDN